MSQSLYELITGALKVNSTISVNDTHLKEAIQGTEGFEHFPYKARNFCALVSVTESHEIKALIDLANQCATNPKLAFSLYPISTGNNWGYGSRQPNGIKKNIVLLNLGKLNNIIDFDPELGLVTLEPGVTQQQLSDFLQNRNDHYMVPVTGAGPECSLLANALERGYGITPHTDHFAAVTSMQGYWANGSAYQSAINELDESVVRGVDKAYKWGLGPYLEGLFSQSNLGIVSQMTIRLAKKKPGFCSFFIQLKSDNHLEFALPVVRRILQEYEGIVGAINVIDQRRLISMLTSNPNKNAHKIMSEIQLNIISENLRVPYWTIVGSIYGSKGVVKVTKKEIKQLFNKIPCRQLYSDHFIITLANKIMPHIPAWLINKNSLLSSISTQLTTLQQGKDIMLGIPNKVALKLAYWRHKDANTFDNTLLSPAADGCGLLWYAPLINMKIEAIREFIHLVRTTCSKHNIEPFITLTHLRHDSIDSSIPIVFDLTNARAVNDAHQCLKKLTKEGLKKGFVPYRLNIDQQQWLLSNDKGFWKTVDLIKKSLDPHNVMSIDRYNPK